MVEVCKYSSTTSTNATQAPTQHKNQQQCQHLISNVVWKGSLFKAAV